MTWAGSRATAYAGRAVVGYSLPGELFDFDSAPGFTGGLYVG